MGQPKQLLPWQRGTLLSHAIEKSLQVEQLKTFVILGAYAQRIKKEVEHFPITIVYNKDWESGMGTSIRSAITYFSENSLRFKAVLITLVDQPMVDVIHINSLISAFNKNRGNIIATVMKKGVGVPAIFPFSYFGELLALTEDYGARYILRKNEDIIIPIEGENKVEDIDTIEQYQRLFDMLKRTKKAF